MRHLPSETKASCQIYAAAARKHRPALAGVVHWLVSALAPKGRVFDSKSRADVRTQVPLRRGDQRARTEGPLEDRDGEDRKEAGLGSACTCAHSW